MEDLLALAYGTLSYAKCQISTFLARTYFHGLSLFEPTPVSRRGLLYHSIERLLKKVDAAAIRRNRNYQSAQMGRDHGQAEADKIVRQDPERFGLSDSDLKSLPGSDPIKVTNSE